MSAISVQGHTWSKLQHESQRDKNYFLACAPNENSNHQLIHVFWSLSPAWRNFASLAIHNVPSEDSDQPVHAHWLNRLFTGHIMDSLNLRWAHISKGMFSAAAAHIWASTWQNVQNGMCPQRRVRSAWASPKSDQSLCCLHEESLGP